MKLPPRSRIVLLTVLACILLGGAIWSFPLAYQKIKVFRARQLVAPMQEYYESGDWANFEIRLRAASRLAPFDQEVMLAYARYLAARNHRLALDYWIGLVSRYPRLSDAWDGFFLTAIQQKDHQMAGLALEGFRRSAPKRIDRAREHEVQLLAALGRLQEAISTARTHLAQSAPGDAFKVAAYQLMLEGSDTDREEALQWLWEHADGQDETSLAALVILAGIRQLNQEETQTIIEHLLNHPQALLQHGHLATALQARLATAEGESPDNVWRQFFGDKPLAARVQIAKWLIASNEYAFAAMAFKPEEAWIQRDAAVVHLELLASREDWDAFSAFVANSKAPLPEYVRLAYSARGAKEKGNATGFEFSWKRALNKANSNISSLSFLANYADLHGWEHEAETACRELLQVPNGSISGWLGLYNLAIKTQNQTMLSESRTALRNLLGDFTPLKTSD